MSSIYSDVLTTGLKNKQNLHSLYCVYSKYTNTYIVFYTENGGYCIFCWNQKTDKLDWIHYSENIEAVNQICSGSSTSFQMKSSSANFIIPKNPPPTIIEKKSYECPLCKAKPMKEMHGMYGIFYNCHLWATNGCQGKRNKNGSITKGTLLLKNEQKKTSSKCILSNSETTLSDLDSLTNRAKKIQIA